MNSSVHVTEAGDYVVIKGPDRDAVDQARQEFSASGAITVGALSPLGNNWVATVRRPRRQSWIEVTNIGLQSVVEGSSEAAVRERVGQMVDFGAVLIAGPEEVNGKWAAVVDVRAGGRVNEERRRA